MIGVAAAVPALPVAVMLKVTLLGIATVEGASLSTVTPLDVGAKFNVPVLGVPTVCVHDSVKPVTLFTFDGLLAQVTATAPLPVAPGVAVKPTGAATALDDFDEDAEGTVAITETELELVRGTTDTAIPVTGAVGKTMLIVVLGKATGVPPSTE